MLLDFVMEPAEATNRKKLCWPEQEGIVVVVLCWVASEEAWPPG